MNTLVFGTNAVESFIRKRVLQWDNRCIVIKLEAQSCIEGKAGRKSDFVVFNWGGLISFVGVVESSAAEEEDEEGGGGGDDGKEEVNEVLEAEDINELDQPGETSG